MSYTFPIYFSNLKHARARFKRGRALVIYFQWISYKFLIYSYAFPIHFLINLLYSYAWRGACGQKHMVLLLLNAFSAMNGICFQKFIKWPTIEITISRQPRASYNTFRNTRASYHMFSTDHRSIQHHITPCRPPRASYNTFSEYQGFI